MEFFEELEKPDINIDDLKNLLTINKLPTLCKSIDTVISNKGNEGEIYCLWGLFNIRREVIKYGIRFTLLNCPHALAWTITINNQNKNIIIHCTIDKKEQEEEFIDSINQFIKDWSYGIKAVLK